MAASEHSSSQNLDLADWPVLEKTDRPLRVDSTDWRASGAAMAMATIRRQPWSVTG